MTQQPQRLDPASEAAFLNNPMETVDSSGSPLRDFEGTVADVEIYLQQYQDGRAGHQVKLKFTDMVVHNSITPWPWKIGELNFNKSGDNVSPNSGLGIFINSIVNIWGAGHSYGELKTHKVHITYTPGHSVRRPPTDEAKAADANAQWRDVEIEAFEVVSINGVKAGGQAVAGGNGPSTAVTSPTTHSMPGTTPVANLDTLLTVLANGKTQKEFADLATQNAQVQADGTIFNNIMGTPELVLAGLVAKEMLEAKDDGGVVTYHQVTG